MPLLPFGTAVGVALSHGRLWLCVRRNGGDAAVVGTQQQAQTEAQHQRQHQVVLPLRHLRRTALTVLNEGHVHHRQSLRASVTSVTRSHASAAEHAHDVGDAV